MDFEEKLVEAVRSFPCLWQTTSKCYRDIRARENAWKEVAQQVESTPEKCASKWKTLSDKYVKELKKVKGKRSGDAGPGYTSSWRLFSVMEFLRDSVKHRQTEGNFTEPAEIPQEETPAEESVISVDSEVEEITRSQVISPYPASSRPESMDFEPPPPKKRKKGNRGNDDLDELLIKNMQHMQQRIDDEDAMFGRQVAATLRRLTNRQKAIAKLRIHGVLLDTEFPEQFTPQPSTLYSSIGNNQC